MKLGHLSRKWAQLGLLTALLVAFAPTLALASMDTGQFRASLGVDCSARVITQGITAGSGGSLPAVDSTATGTTSSAHCHADCGYCFWNAPAALPQAEMPPMPAAQRTPPHEPRRQVTVRASSVFLHDAAPRGPPLSC